MSEGNISLCDLLNLSIGSPQRGSVNFSALHALLLAVLKQLNIREVRTPWRDSPLDDRPTRALEGGPADTEEDRLTEEEQRDVSALVVVQPGTELQDELRAASPTSATPTPDTGPAADDQSKLRSRIQTCEDNLSKAMELIQQLHGGKDNLKDGIELGPQQQVLGAQVETAAVEKCCHRVDALEDTVRSLTDMLQKYPDPEELSQCVTWDIMQSALLSERENIQKELVNSGVVDWPKEIKPTSTPSSSPPPADYAVRSTAPSSPTFSGDVSTLDEAADPSETPPSHPPLPPTQSGGPADAATSQPRKAHRSDRYPEALEALRNISKLQDRFSQMEARVAVLEKEKVDQSQLARLKEQVPSKGSRDASNKVMEQLNQQRALIDSLMSDREKLDGLEEMVMNLSVQERETTSEAASESVNSDSKGFHELKQQVTYLRKSVQKLEENVKQLRTKQAQSEERTADQHLQDQLDDLRGMLEDMMLSLTSQLSSSHQEDGDGEQEESDGGGLGLSQGAERSAFTVRAVNIGRNLSLLFQHYEQLQDTVNSLIQQQQQTEGRAGPLKDSEENVELVNDVQRAILQLQADCEKLHATTRFLHEDNKQKQSDIEELYKTTEELEVKKADKRMVESEIKADKSALESKVSRMQFDSATEQLNSMFHELLNKVTGQEQDWHKVIDRLSTEMECKLNRIELDSVKKQLEDRWKNIHKKLQAQGAPDPEDAAGIRKQLVDRFHCLSCDRPVVKHTPGPQLVTLPSTPAFPSHKSIRPFTVYALEQLRQHYRNERMSELTDYGYPVLSRSCGGSHTNTSVTQRRSGLQHTKQHAEVDGVIQSEEVDIVGLDGHIYKGRLNVPTVKSTETKLPTISTKDGMCKTKDKAKCPSSYRPAASPEMGHNSPLPYAHSAKSAQCSRSASSCSGRDWPVSALGCTSQSSVTPGSAAAAAAADGNTEHQSDDRFNL
ncbi:glutamine-rich protein 2 isoform X2 [Mugil cephalus]|uniref:glutamine-rich protein 2 isoform X2 n=1 Tax=Mugil cephalus TaxID=48193 RepID=UPI001FB7C491|nr:glutamine-rich protein 2 isoform X2 [Mugil cephalus]